MLRVCFVPLYAPTSFMLTGIPVSAETVSIYYVYLCVVSNKIESFFVSKRDDKKIMMECTAVTDTHNQCMTYAVCTERERSNKGVKVRPWINIKHWIMCTHNRRTRKTARDRKWKMNEVPKTEDNTRCTNNKHQRYSMKEQKQHWTPAPH